MEKAVFLDRDGVIIRDTGYVGSIDKVEFLPGAAGAIRGLNRAGFKVIVVSNQAGVARGYYTEAAVGTVNDYIRDSLAREGAVIDAFYYCPHHAEGVVEQYRMDCYDRKPNPGMIEAAARDFDIDLGKSFLIGDKASDIEAGRRAGVRTVFLTGGQENSVPEADRAESDLPAAVRWLKGV